MRGSAPVLLLLAFLDSCGLSLFQCSTIETESRSVRGWRNALQPQADDHSFKRYFGTHSAVRLGKASMFQKMPFLKLIPQVA
jgi:hypothetical protein